ncbi:MAG: hypothetical protein KDC52_08265, partial [Ignavibacteriae bacterium]|nr:hypothetical protein [Ignavibacteriota bacterium]
MSRVFSYILTYHFVYVIIALAILSYALGQLYASRVVLKKEVSLSKYFIILQFLFPISLMAIFILPSIGFVGSVSTGLILYSILAGISFFLVGLICAVIFQEYRDKIANLYALDMSGAATGAILGLFLLNNLNLIASLSAILVIFSLCSILFNYNLKKKRIFYFISSISILLISLYMILNTPRVEINMAKSTDKDLLRLQSIPSIKTKIIETRWNSFGRTDLVNFIYPDSSSSTSMFIDGAAGTEVVDISELQKDKTILAHTLAHSNLYFPFNFLNDNEKDSALIIGPGGGYDIAMAYFGDVKIIDAIEVNPTFVELMRQYNKSTFTEKQNVNIFVQEGRNFVRSTTNKYDLIFITIPITKGVRSTDFINLTENYLFTQEALRDYLSVLTNEGRIVLTLHNSEEVYKVLSNYLDMNSKFGIPNSESFKNIYVVDSGMKPLLVIKKTPFTKSEINERHFVAHRLNFDKGISFFPFIQQLEFDTVLLGENYRLTMFDNVLYDVSVNKYSFHEVTERAAINLHPVYDDSPFFFNYELGIPQNLNPLIFVGIILSIISTYMFKKNWGMVLEYKTNNELVAKRAF